MLYRIKKADLISLEEGKAKELAAQSDNQTDFITQYILTRAGLDKPVLSIEQAANAHPRAYHTYASIYYDVDGPFIPNDELLIDVPSGYRNNGDEIKPDVPYDIIPKEEADTLLQGIHGGGWGPFCGFLFLPRHGTAMPANYTKDATVIDSATYQPVTVYVEKHNGDKPSPTMAFLKQANDKDKELLIIETYGDATLYSVRPLEGTPPQSLKALPKMTLPTYQWILADAFDETLCNNRNSVPPMPKQVQAELAYLGLSSQMPLKRQLRQMPRP